MQQFIGFKANALLYAGDCGYLVGAVLVELNKKVTGIVVFAGQ